MKLVMDMIVKIAKFINLLLGIVWPQFSGEVGDIDTVWLQLSSWI